MRQVTLQFTLVGNTRFEGMPKDYTNQDKLLRVKDTVLHQFGDRPIAFVDEFYLNQESIRYPSYFIAGWFISKESLAGSNVGSELVLIAHGNSMKNARDNLMNGIRNIEWDKNANDIKND